MINVRIQNNEVQKLTPKITVIGVGGAGGNAVKNMIQSDLQGVEFLVCNTDAQALEMIPCDGKIQLGATVTGGLGAGAKPEVGKAAAEESLEEVMEYLEGSNMAFITAGMGGGTGTGAAPIIAKACREKGILTVGVVTKPFHFEGTLRMKMAESGIEEMQDYVDTLIVIPNQNLFRVANEKTTFAEAFKMADGVLQSGVRGVTDLMVMPGMINLDFADVRSAMLEMGKAMMGTGEAEGDRRPIEAAEAAINNPLLDDVSMKGARGVIINVTGGQDMTLFEVDEACNRIRDEVDPNANIIFGSTFDDTLEGVMRVSVVATGIEVAEKSSSQDGFGGKKFSTDRKFERVQPQTSTQDTGGLADSVALGTNAVAKEAAAPKAPSYPVPPARPQAATGGYEIPKAPVTAPAEQAYDEPEKDMFEQQSFAAEQSAEGASLRGTVYGNSFIPPKPAEPEQMRETQGFHGTTTGSFVSQQQQAQQSEQRQEPVQSQPTRAPEAEYTPAPAAAPAQQRPNLNPPVPGSSESYKKRSPSLFERFTSPLRSSHDEPRQEETQGETGKGSGSFHTGLRATKCPSQGNLDIESPRGEKATSGASEDELDIPAFLRRQAN